MSMKQNKVSLGALLIFSKSPTTGTLIDVFGCPANYVQCKILGSRGLICSYALVSSAFCKNVGHAISLLFYISIIPGFPKKTALDVINP